MSNQSESLQLNFEGDAPKEMVIRHGTAEPIHTPSKLSLDGNFNAPAEFVKKRFFKESGLLDRFQKDDCHVIFNEFNLSITLVAGEQERDTVTIFGKLEKNEFLESLNINGRGHKNTDLLNLIRFKGHLFASRDKHRSLVAGLQNFEVKTDTEHKSANDRQGTVENRQYTKAQSELSGFQIELNVPFFEGHQPAPINLTIEIEPNNGSVLLYLVSETYEEFYEEAVKAQFDGQRSTFEPFVIIEK